MHEVSLELKATKLDCKDSGKPTANVANSKSEVDMSCPKDVNGSATGLQGRDEGLTLYFSYNLGI